MRQNTITRGVFAQFLTLSFFVYGNDGGFLRRVFQKKYTQKVIGGALLSTLGTFQNGILENILYRQFSRNWPMVQILHELSFKLTVFNTKFT
jgi:hypothetical protein